jgi:hypothetical protein
VCSTQTVILWIICRRAARRAHVLPGLLSHDPGHFDLGDIPVGIIGRVVGASFAVLVTEELSVSGCELLISVTSAGQITPLGQPPYFVLIERAL